MTVGHPRAIVVGGGIAGLATAIGLRRSGWRVDVLERAEHPADSGAGLVLWPNGVHALDWLGLGDALRALATADVTGGIRRPDGRWLSRTDTATLAARLHAPTLGVHRASLHQMLRAALPDGPQGRVRTGVEVVEVARAAGGQPGLSVRAADGESPVADLVVAADGIDSRLRPQFVGGPGPREVRQVAWRAVVDVETAGVGGETWGRGERFGFVPLIDRRAYWFAVLPAGQVPTGYDPERDLTLLRDRFGGWHRPIGAMLSATDPARLLRHPIRALPAPPRLYHRVLRQHGVPDAAVVLVGDAAHAMTPDLGQGACQALEDAVALAGVLGPAGADVADLIPRLAAYEESRHPRTTRLLSRSRRMGRVAMLRGMPGAARDTFVRLTPAGVALRGLESVAGWRPGDIRSGRVSLR